METFRYPQGGEAQNVPCLSDRQLADGGLDWTAGAQPVPHLPDCELPAAAAWPEPAWRHHQVRWHGQKGDQQTDQTQGEEERVDESVDEEGNV